jgi:4-hydroxy-3-methylbut-2-enyl diphosphate reductase
MAVAARISTMHVQSGELVPERHAFVAHGLDRISCGAVDLLTGSLRRSGVPVVPVTSVRGGEGELIAVAAFLPGEEDAQRALCAGASAGLGGALPAVRSAIVGWAAVSGPHTVLLAAPRSFCAGVGRAVEIVERVLEQVDGPVYVRKQIVHNSHVVKDLERRGAVFVGELDAVPDGATVVFSAHGVSPQVRAVARDRGLAVVDATCPLVAKVHAEVRRYAARGDTVVLIGHAHHDEVEGTLGEAPDVTVLVENVGDVARLDVPDPAKVSVVTQTTLAASEVEEVAAALRTRYPGLRQPANEDICYATTNRQAAVTNIAADADVVIVIGSVTSHNSGRLVQRARQLGTPAYLVDDPSGIRPEWLSGAPTIGLTAGASAPPRMVERVIDALRGLGPVACVEREVAREEISFGLPAGVDAPSAG